MAIKISTKVEQSIRSWAWRKKLDPNEALDKLIGTAINRLKALEKYQKSPKGKRAAKRGAAKGRSGPKGKKTKMKMKRAA